MLPLARLGISALDKWYNTLPSHLMNPLVMQVLPHLDPFLRSKGNLIKLDKDKKICEKVD
jgi:hypothetical protein